MPETPPLPSFKKSTLKKMGQDPEATAKAVKLVYVNSKDEGISRVRAGKGFKYFYQNKIIKDKKTLERIRSLVIPPAWKDVWICANADGHLQATGVDERNRKQYHYHSLWNEMRKKTKFYRLPSLAKRLPDIRRQLEKDLALPGLSKKQGAGCCSKSYG